MSDAPEPSLTILELLELHDGDDRCGCLNMTVVQLVDLELDRQDVLPEVEQRLRECIAEHPAGSTWRAQQVASLTEPSGPFPG